MFERVRAVVARVMEVDPASVTPETRFVEDLGTDSLAVIQIVEGLEEEFFAGSLIFADEDLERIQTVGDAVQYVVKALGA